MTTAEITTPERIGTKVWDNKRLVASANAITLEISDSGYAQVCSTWHAEETALPFTRIYIVEAGSAWIADRTQTLPMEPNRVYVIPAGAPCAYGCDSHMRKLFFHVNVYRPDRYDILWGSSQIGCFPLEPDLVQRLIHHYQGSSYLDAVIVQRELLGILSAYLDTFQAATENSPSYSDVVAQTIDYIHRNLSAKLRNEELAKRLFISRTYLTDRFRKETGTSLGRYIDDQLMFEAQLRLCKTDASIRTISKELGFSDQFYFSRRFKELCGMTPLQYRKNNR